MTRTVVLLAFLLCGVYGTFESLTDAQLDPNFLATGTRIILTAAAAGTDLSLQNASPHWINILNNNELIAQVQPHSSYYRSNLFAQTVENFTVIVLDSNNSTAGVASQAISSPPGFLIHVNVSTGPNLLPSLAVSGVPAAACSLQQPHFASLTFAVQYQSTDSVGFYCTVPATFNASVFAVGTPHVLTLLSYPQLVPIAGEVTFLTDSSWSSASATEDLCSANVTVIVSGVFNASAPYECTFLLQDGAGRSVYRTADAFVADNFTLLVPLALFNTAGDVSLFEVRDTSLGGAGKVAVATHGAVALGFRSCVFLYRWYWYCIGVGGVIGMLCAVAYTFYTSFRREAGNAREREHLVQHVSSGAHIN